MTYLEVVVVLDRDNGDRELLLEEVGEPRLGRLISAFPSHDGPDAA